MDYIPLFASNLFYSKVEDETVLNEIEKISKTEKYTQVVDDDVNDSGIDVRVLEKIPSSKNYLLDSCYNLFQNTLKYPCQFEITTSWFTRSRKGAGSRSHKHTNCFYSAVLYFGEYEEETVGQIEFSSPIDSYFNYSITPTEWNIFNSKTWSIKPQHGLLIFFPSFLPHRIKPHKSKNIRRSLAFNVIPVGEYGEYDSLFNTEWVS